jgi:hypothetical protein
MDSQITLFDVTIFKEQYIHESGFFVIVACGLNLVSLAGSCIFINHSSPPGLVG